MTSFCYVLLAPSFEGFYAVSDLLVSLLFFFFLQLEGVVDHLHCRQGEPKETDRRDE